jgi:hypothetical protein
MTKNTITYFCLKHDHFELPLPVLLLRACFMFDNHGSPVINDKPFFEIFPRIHFILFYFVASRHIIPTPHAIVILF